MKIIELGGRKLRVLSEANIAHDYWMSKQVRAAGIDQIDIDPKRDAVDTVQGILDLIIDSGSAMTILGGLLMPVDVAAKDWTPLIAEDMTDLLNALLHETDKAVVRALVAEAILGFFYTGLVSLRTSRTSLTKSHEPGKKVQFANDATIVAI